MIPHTHIPKVKYKQVLSTNKQQDPNFPYQKKGEHSSAFWTEKNVFFKNIDEPEKTNILNLFLKNVYRTIMLSLDLLIHQYFQTLHVGSLPCLETLRALLSNFSAFHSHFISIQHNLNPDPRAEESFFYNFH